jgi:hypothetical protein
VGYPAFNESLTQEGSKQLPTSLSLGLTEAGGLLKAADRFPV